MIGWAAATEIAAALFRKRLTPEMLGEINEVIQCALLQVLASLLGAWMLLPVLPTQKTDYQLEANSPSFVVTYFSLEISCPIAL